MEGASPTPGSRFEQHLGYWLRRVSNHVSANFKRALKRKSTSGAEWVVLCHVHERPGTTPGELASALSLTRGAVSKIIDKLEAKAWITASIKPQDNRVRFISLTRKGSKLLPVLTVVANANDQAFFDVLGNDEKATLQLLLSKLVKQHNIGTVPIE